MNRKEYMIVAAAIHRTAIVNGMEGNAIKRAARNAALTLVTSDLIGSFKHEYSNFDEEKFRAACER